ncbi:MAG: hypothetical protein ACOYJI_02115 [Anaerovoracaceae bacterium]|jgi:hypothetical protein
MFRIKQDDYNTVQFMPDYKSSGASRKKQKPAPAVESIGSKPQRARARRNMIIVLVIIIAACLACAYVYFNYFTQDARYIRAFNNSNYKTAEEIATNNKDSGSFSDKIGDTVVSAADDALSQYKDGEESASDAIAELTQYDEASAGLFNAHIQQNIDAINSIENVYATINQASEEAQNGEYDNSLESLQSAASGAEENGLNVDDQIKQVLTDNLLGFKYTLFTEYAVTVRYSSDFTSMKNSISFITKYIDDSDFTNFAESVTQVENSQLRRAVAASEARQVAKQAKQDMSDSTSTSTTSSSSTSSTSSTAS